MEHRKLCPSDISPEQFAQIRPLLESVRKRTKPPTVDLSEVFNAVLLSEPKCGYAVKSRI